jgi:hypothetical protein
MMADELKNALDELPIIGLTPCADCGATQFASCNINEKGQMHQCSECHEYDEQLRKLVRKNSQ